MILKNEFLRLIIQRFYLLRKNFFFFFKNNEKSIGNIAHLRTAPINEHTCRDLIKRNIM